MLDQNLRKQLGYLLWLERANQCKDIRWAAKKMHLEVGTIDFLEHGKGHPNWKIYQRLLNLYHKDIKIELVDKDDVS